MALRVARPGLLTTVQDLGRWGFQSRGVPVAGAMDPFSHRLANRIVGNPDEAATLEVTVLGPALVFEDERVAAVTGAHFEVTLDGRVVRPCQPVLAGAGSVLEFGRRLRGTRAYVGISGGVATPAVFGSRATHAASAMGGVDGRALKAGDRLPLGSRGGAAASGVMAGIARGVEPWEPPDGHARVRVLAGPHLERFTDGALDVLQSERYTIQVDSDRMGFRLRGPVLTGGRREELISEATPLGAIQVPASGEPILLMADRQTVGGYPQLATVITADIGLAGQLGPGDAISFAVCSRAEARRALASAERALEAMAGATR